MSDGTLIINTNVRVALSEIELKPIRAQGPGGQNVNKVSSAIHLRFDVRASSLTSTHKARILSINDQRMTCDGVIVIKAQSSRTQAQNKQDALARLRGILYEALKTRKARKATKPSWGSVQRSRTAKTKRSSIKSTRRKVRNSDE